ncbi:hypothetical protein QJS10_CPB04g00198 [Acorus calamus]|uniref:DUF4408 domain-containing protein n=1 Tax=Acorus calamus TaxID=4465 RepID=A0AAV9F0H3_ACOCL|nr:hypothetical protein QJS10_CPB04g00198 [Acorus calamus]
MDHIHIEKLQAMKRYKRRKQTLLQTIIHNTILVLLLGLFLSCPLWLPNAFSWAKLFVWKAGAFVSGPGCLFVVCNIIVVFLVGESKLAKGPGGPDIYEEYIERNKGLKGVGMVTNNNGEVEELVVEEKIEEVDEEEMEEEMMMEGDQEEMDWATEELNRKVEDFIARVNWQMRHEE